MILIGQYDSPFVRRVAIAMLIYGLEFEHRPWSTFKDADRIRPFNSLLRVPVLVLDDGLALVDSHAMLDYLDSLVPPEHALFPAGEPARRQALRIAALGTGIADKAVSLFYEMRLHAEQSLLWVERCRAQIMATLHVLEADRSARAGPFWFGDDPGHADIVVATALRFLTEAHSGLVDMADYPALRQHAADMEATPQFVAIQQVFVPPS